MAEEKGLKDKMIVADINFVCEDSWLYDLLAKRGETIKNHEYHELKLLN